MDFEHNRETDLNPPSSWFVLCQLLGGYTNLLLAIIGIAAIVDQFMPGRTLRAEVIVACIALPWGLLMRRLGAISKPRRPKDGSRTVLFVFYLVCFSSILPLYDWWARTPTLDWTRRSVGSVLMALIIAGFLSLREKGVWLEPSGEPPANQTPPRTV